MKFGTKEWADVNKNILLGCEHNCRYCYARWNAFKRFKQIDNPEKWMSPSIVLKKFSEKPKLHFGRIMFPTQHDITPKFLDKTVEYLKPWLELGNKFLIVSKPHHECVEVLCKELGDYRDQITFRFTIGSRDNETLAFWEENAPRYEERLESLKYAFYCGWKTSVSIEPMLDTDVASLVREVLPYVTDTVWIGKVNSPGARIDKTSWTEDELSFMREMDDTCRSEFVWDVYNTFKDNPKVRWKESIKKVIGLPDEEIG